MYHVAVMKKSLGFIPAILFGTKTIESRWYVSRRAPWGKVTVGDVIYFKNVGELVSLKACVGRVEQYDLRPGDAQRILEKYGTRIGFSQKQIAELSREYKTKKYCVLIFLEEVGTVPAFNIEKKGLGAMSAWMTMTKEEFEERKL